MNTDVRSAQDDLAFLRALVEAGDDNYRVFGEGYFAAGVIYGGQMLLHAAQLLGWIASSGPVGLLIGLGPSLVFLGVLTWLLARNRKRAPNGLTSRALGAVFASAGLANLALIAVIGAVAWREHSLTTWLIYPCTVFVLQGAAWLVAFALRRRAWLGLMALILFASAIAMAVSIENLAGYIAFASLALFLGMGLPGWIMMRSHPKSA